MGVPLVNETRLQRYVPEGMRRLNGLTLRFGRD
jgi:hypothetical protein